MTDTTPGTLADRTVANAEILATQKMIRDKVIPLLLKELTKSHIYVDTQDFEIYYRPQEDLVSSVRGGNPVRLFIHVRPTYPDFLQVIRNLLKLVDRYKTDNSFKRRGLSYAFARALRDAKPEIADVKQIPGTLDPSRIQVERYYILRIRDKKTGAEVSEMFPTFGAELATYEKLLIQLSEKVMTLSEGE
jgi:hypothetical protein